MKKLIVTSFLLLSGLMLSAQWSVSVRNGITIPSLSEEPRYLSPDGIVYNFDESPINSYLPEIGVCYSFKHFSINSGVSYLSLGYNELNFDYIYKYMSIPLFVKYTFNVDKFYLSPELGLNLSLETNAYEYYEAHGTSDPADISFSEPILTAKDFIPNFLFGVGVGYNINNKYSFDVSYRYNFGLSDFDSRFDRKFNYSQYYLGVNYKF